MAGYQAHLHRAATSDTLASFTLLATFIPDARAAPAGSRTARPGPPTTKRRVGFQWPGGAWPGLPGAGPRPRPGQPERWPTDLSD